MLTGCNTLHLKIWSEPQGVRVNRAGNVFEGPELQLKVDTFEGFFLKPSYTLLRGQGQGHGQADRVDFVDEHRVVAYNASFTTCRRDPGAQLVARLVAARYAREV